jgi:phosphate:Na+ symporter
MAPATRIRDRTDMSTILSTLAGGIGLFLFGMVLMTDGLKALAGDALRRLLQRFTGNRLSAIATGAAVTALVQSSSATTLATIGFVSAGLLGFGNAIGVILGANLGTTSTGWLVSLLGLKFSIAAFAMPLVGAGALMRLLGRDRVAQAGSVLAGFGLIFVGIDVLQDGMAGLAGRIDLAEYAGSGVAPRLALVGVGALMTVLMQSSSAAVATTLTALAGGAINTEQAAALVIGQNIGTTVTAGIAALGASVAAKRTALVHVVFNIGAGSIAFAILPWFVDVAQRLTGDDGSGAAHALTIAAFHTLFNLLGVLVFLPLIPRLAALATRLLPEHRPALTRHLDPSLREVPALAIGASVTTLRAVLAEAFAAAGRSLRGAHHPGPAVFATWREATEAAGQLVERLPPGYPRALDRLTACLHLVDHARQFVRAAGKPARYLQLDALPALGARAGLLGGALIAVGAALAERGPVPADPLPQTPPEGVSGGLRADILAASAAGTIELDQALAALNAQRWLERLTHHASRALVYLDQLDGASVSD